MANETSARSSWPAASSRC